MTGTHETALISISLFKPYSEQSTAAFRYYRHVLGIFYTLVFLAQSMVPGPFPVEIVLDGSQAMHTPVGGSNIQTVVRDAVVTVIAEAQNKQGELAIGLRVAGGRASADGPCSATEPLIPVGDADWGRWTKALNTIKPRGKRPLIAAVSAAIGNVARDNGKSRVVVITTGVDQCESNLQEVAAALSAVGDSVELRLVGLNLDSAAIDAFGGVTLRNVTTPSELLDAIRWGVLEIDDLDLHGDSPAPTPTEIPALLSAPNEIAAGAEFELSWTGPEGPEDFLSLSLAESADNEYLDWARVEDGNPTVFTAPLEAGSYELRYVDGESGSLRGRASLEVVAIPIELRVPPTATAGLRFEVAWTANAADGDFVAISKVGSPVPRYLEWASTAAGSPTTLAAPLKPGSFEVRYYSKGGQSILARTEIEIQP